MWYYEETGKGIIILRSHMRPGSIVIILFSAIILFFSGCAPESGINKKKFSELNRTVQDLKTALSSEEPCNMPDKLLQSLNSGITSLKDKAASQDEHRLIAAYSDLLIVCNDGMLLCRSRSKFVSFQFVPKGRVYVTQDLDPLVEKYGFTTERHLYQPTGEYWRSIAADSINVIWENARFQIKIIENMVNYN